MKYIPTQPEIVKQRVCELLNWNEMDYAEYQFQMGTAYLMWYLPCDEELRQKLSYSKMFWNWWKRLWCMHDDSWISFHLSLNEMHVKMRWALYQELHNPRILVLEEKPTQVIIESLKTKEDIHEYYK